MALRVRVLLLACAAVIVCVAAALAYVALRRDPVPTAATPAATGPSPSVAAGTDGNTDPQTAEASKPPTSRQRRKAPTAPPSGSGNASEPASPESPDEAAARQRTEQDAVAKQDEFAADIRGKIIRDFALTHEQAVAADPIITRMIESARPLFALQTESRAMREDLRRQAQENNWTHEQIRQARTDQERQLVLDHKAELLTFLDEATNAMLDLRKLATPEQVDKIDKQINRLAEVRPQVLQGSLEGL